MSHEELLTTKELAAEMKRSEWYIRAMRKAGFPMPGGTATIEEARLWLVRRPDFNARAVMTGAPPPVVESDSVLRKI